MRPPLFILCFYRTGRYPAHPPQLGRKAGQTVPMPVQGVGMPPPPLKPCAAALRGEIWCGCDGEVSLPSGCASCCQRTPGRVSRARIFRFMPATAGLLMPRSSRPKSSKFRINETGWYHYPRRGPRAPETLRGHGSGGHTLPFYALCSPAAGVNAMPSFSALSCARCRSTVCPAFSS